MSTPMYNPSSSLAKGYPSTSSKPERLGRETQLALNVSAWRSRDLSLTC